MGTDRLGAAPAVKLFVAIMTGQNEYQAGVEELIAASFGPIERRSDIFNFSSFSQYYDIELGDPVWKYLISFRQLVQADKLISVKIATEALQLKYSVICKGQLQRTVNLDPGYVTGWNVVLSTVKNNSHRIYMREGIFTELTLLYRDRSFQPLGWTYSDYRSPEVLEFLELVRKDWLAECRGS